MSWSFESLDRYPPHVRERYLSSMARRDRNWAAWSLILERLGVADQGMRVAWFHGHRDQLCRALLEVEQDENSSQLVTIAATDPDPVVRAVACAVLLLVGPDDVASVSYELNQCFPGSDPVFDAVFALRKERVVQVLGELPQPIDTRRLVFASLCSRRELVGATFSSAPERELKHGFFGDWALVALEEISSIDVLSAILDVLPNQLNFEELVFLARALKRIGQHPRAASLVAKSLSRFRLDLISLDDVEVLARFVRDEVTGFATSRLVDSSSTDELAVLAATAEKLESARDEKLAKRAASVREPNFDPDPYGMGLVPDIRCIRCHAPRYEILGFRDRDIEFLSDDCLQVKGAVCACGCAHATLSWTGGNMYAGADEC